MNSPVGISLLVVEDDPSIGEPLAEALDHEGYAVPAAPSTRRALEVTAVAGAAENGA